MLINSTEQDWTRENNPQTDIVYFGGANRSKDLVALDNFSTRFSFSLHGKHYASIEHAFQSLKFVTAHELDYAEKIRSAASPQEAKRLGRSQRLARAHLDAWKSHQAEECMRQCLEARFGQNIEANEILKRTGDAILVEKVEDDPNWDDRIWGCGKGGRGRNLMGLLLMEIRATL